MAKNQKTINRFDSGIVEGPNPRDIADEASVNIESLDPSTIGGLRPLGNTIAATNPAFGDMHAILLNQVPLNDNLKGYGYGLFQFTSDYPNLSKYNAQELASDGTDTGSVSTDFDSSAVDDTEETLYTLLLAADGSAITDQGVIKLYIQEYNLTTTSVVGLFRLGRNSYVGAAENAEDATPIATSPTKFDMAWASADGDNTTWPTPGGSPPSKPYLPKFYFVNGYPRMYDANQEGINYFIGFIKKGFKSNIYDHETLDVAPYSQLELEGQQDDCMKVNQWSVEPNFLRTPIVTKKPYAATLTWKDNGITQEEFDHNDTFRVPVGANFGMMADRFGAYIVSAKFTANAEGGSWIKAGGPISFFYSFVYDGNQEGPLAEKPFSYYPSYTDAAAIDENCTLSIGVTVSASASKMVASLADKIGGNLNNYPGPRCSGWKMYYSYGESTALADDDDTQAVDDSNIYLLWEMDWDKGYRIAGTSNWSKMANFCHFQHVYHDPPQFEDFVTENGYMPGQDVSASFSTAVFAKQRTWIGNITKNGVSYPDRILKSPIGMPDLFPDDNYIDIVGSDGDRVIHLESVGNELLVFKKRTLYILNIEDLDAEKLTAKKPNLGVTNYKHVCQTPHGIVWVNQGGVWMYEDEKVINLLAEEGVDKISGETWRLETQWDQDDISAGKLDIGYSQENDKLIILMNIIPNSSTAGDIFVYHFKTKSWTKGRNSFPQSVSADDYYCTNLIHDYQGRILIAGADSDAEELLNSKRKIDFFHWDEALTTEGSNTIPQDSLKWSSKDMDFDNLGGKKTITKIYITYRIASTGNSLIRVRYSVDGDSATKYHFSNSSTFSDKTSTTVTCYNQTNGLVKTNGVFRTAALVPDNRQESKKINSFQLHLDNPTGVVSKNLLNIDDITIIHKNHTVK